MIRVSSLLFAAMLFTSASAFAADTPDPNATGAAALPSGSNDAATPPDGNSTNTSRRQERFKCQCGCHNSRRREQGQTKDCSPIASLGRRLRPAPCSMTRFFAARDAEPAEIAGLSRRICKSPDRSRTYDHPDATISSPWGSDSRPLSRGEIDAFKLGGRNGPRGQSADINFHVGCGSGSQCARPQRRFRK